MRAAPLAQHLIAMHSNQCMAAFSLFSLAVEYDQGGSLLSDGKHCVPCSNSTVVFPAVDPYTCQTCPDALMNMQQDGTCVCQAPYSNVSG